MVPILRPKQGYHKSNDLEDVEGSRIAIFSPSTLFSTRNALTLSSHGGDDIQLSYTNLSIQVEFTRRGVLIQNQEPKTKMHICIKFVG